MPKEDMNTFRQVSPKCYSLTNKPYWDRMDLDFDPYELFYDTELDTKKPLTFYPHMFRTLSLEKIHAFLEYETMDYMEVFKLKMSSLIPFITWINISMKTLLQADPFLKWIPLLDFENVKTLFADICVDNAMMLCNQHTLLEMILDKHQHRLDTLAITHGYFLYNADCIGQYSSDWEWESLNFFIPPAEEQYIHFANDLKLLLKYKNIKNIILALGHVPDPEDLNGFAADVAQFQNFSLELKITYGNLKNLFALGGNRPNFQSMSVISAYITKFETKCPLYTLPGGINGINNFDFTRFQWPKLDKLLLHNWNIPLSFLSVFPKLRFLKFFALDIPISVRINQQRSMDRNFKDIFNPTNLPALKKLHFRAIPTDKSTRKFTNKMKEHAKSSFEHVYFNA